MFDRLKKGLDSRRLFERARAFEGEGLHDQAEQTYKQVLDLQRDHAPAWFNLGLIYKRQRRWPESLWCNQRAAELNPKDEAAWWNMGTAATAVRDWEAARAAWRGFGLDVPDGSGPIEVRYGMGCVRLNPEDAGEVVWVHRLDPVRGQIENVPLPESGHRWHDVVLHDGEPNGERVAQGRTYLVFDELERWEPSDIPTLRATLFAPAPEDVKALYDLMAEHALAAEDWTRTVRRLCKACSEGRPHESHDTDLVAWEERRDGGLAAPLEMGERLLTRWTSAGRGRDYERLEVVC